MDFQYAGWHLGNKVILSSSRSCPKKQKVYVSKKIQEIKRWRDGIRGEGVTNIAKDVNSAILIKGIIKEELTPIRL